MRSLVLGGAIIAALLGTSLSASAADTDLYCVRIHGNSGALRCGYETLGACQLATNSGEGTCVENPKNRYSWYR
jgi:Protein of unknown function (DUF3551)